jgi:dTDP-4-amino-4,6-dideoxygalactose transaminase
MLTAICRYGPRIAPETTDIIRECRARGTLIQGPDIARFERAFADRLGVRDAVTTSYGRMAFLYIMQAFGFPPGAEVIVPALTFWVIPEMVRVAGLTPVPADVDPRTFNLDPRAFERAITDRTVAVVPTHLYGLPCDMDAIGAIAERHGLAVVEDCAHALGARQHGQQVGTFGDAAIFSFQTLKPLNTYGGGAAIVRDPALRARVRARAEGERWPGEERVNNRLKVGAAQRFFSRPGVFTLTAYPALLAAALWKARPDVYLWEKIRPLDPMPESYPERYANVQAAIGLASLAHLDRWTAETQTHARIMNDAIAPLPGVQPPFVPDGAEHVYYQYSVYTPDRDALVRRALRRGVDVETFHVDVWPTVGHLARHAHTPAAERACNVVQMPVYAALGRRGAQRVASRIRSLLSSTDGAMAARTDIA